MMFEQTTRRERILVYGSYKLGKSTCWLDIADRYHKAGNEKVHFYVIDTDFGVDKMLDEGYGHLSDMLTVYTPLNFDELLKASKEIAKKVGRGDWIIIDMLSYPWTMAQEHYIHGVFGDEPEDYFMAMRQEVVAKSGKDKRAYGGHEGTDWNFITKIYHQFEFPLSMRSQANIFAVSEEKKLDADRGASPEMVKMFKNVGLMAPAGQKGIGHRFDTVLRMTMRANGQREITMVGDRGKNRGKTWADRGSNTIQIGEGKKGFAGAYLVKVAGWNGKGVKGGKTQPKRSKKTASRRRK
jgi:hypothetical protein